MSPSSRRQAHIESEQKRRQTINEGFEELRRVLEGNDGRLRGGESKALVLRRAVSTVRQLRAEIASLRHLAEEHGVSRKAVAGASGARAELVLRLQERIGENKGSKTANNKVPIARLAPYPRQLKRMRSGEESRDGTPLDTIAIVSMSVSEEENDVASLLALRDSR